MLVIEDGFHGIDFNIEGKIEKRVNTHCCFHERCCKKPRFMINEKEKR
jgi:hypothetical protein